MGVSAISIIKKIRLFCAAPPEFITGPILTILGFKWPLKNGPWSYQEKIEVFKMLHCKKCSYFFRALFIAPDGFRSCGQSVLYSKKNTGAPVICYCSRCIIVNTGLFCLHKIRWDDHDVFGNLLIFLRPRAGEGGGGSISILTPHPPRISGGVF